VRNKSANSLPDYRHHAAGTDGTPCLSVIVAVYNNARALELIFLSLKNQTFRDFEVVVADDGSGPEIAEAVRSQDILFHFPVRHAWQEHDGFRKTIIVNEAVRMARGGYLVFIDGDCVLHRRFLERHWARKKAGRALSGRRVLLDEALSGKIGADDVTGGRIESCRLWRNGCNRSTRCYGLYMPFLFALKNLGRKRHEILGSNFSIHKSDFCRINGYDERIIGRGMEDNNLCNRFKVAGIEIRSVKHEALQYHLFHRSDPIPHDKGIIEKMGRPAEAWTPCGILKAAGPEKVREERSL
jgi:glycosyltransferase involved in cell wall biosynthesis